MFPASKNNWQPSASFENLKRRAEILAQIRHFFSSRGVLEVDTPLMCRTSVTDPHIHSIPAFPYGIGSFAESILSTEGARELWIARSGSTGMYVPEVDRMLSAKESPSHYLQTSPEYAMKRLLAAGSGAIFQICKAFRQDEVGRMHNPEFSMLEWYRPGFDHHALMDEMDELLQLVLMVEPAERKSYAEIFQEFLQIDPHSASLQALATCAQQQKLDVQATITDRDVWLQLLMSECIEPHIGKEKPIFIYHFPASQAALARIQPGNPPTASRFEVYMHGVELANGFHELQDAPEQRKRFEKNSEERARENLPAMQMDELLLAALEHGLPDCAGVAMGLDRLMMIAIQARSISDVLSFDFDRS